MSELSSLDPAFPAVTDRRHVLVAGRVQGVFFRASCAQEAARLGVRGWVRNIADGRVEAAFEGPAPAVAAMVAWCRQGPPGAAIDEVRVDAEPPEGLDGFRILG
jgi:acylphosphatase